MAVGKDIVATLVERGVQPSAQRVAVARYVLDTVEHPSADQVLAKVRRRFPVISRATIYNTLNLFVKKGLLKPLVLTEGKVFFDPNTKVHHHFIDESSGRIYDVPWESIVVSKIESLKEFEVREVQVVMRGRLKRNPKRDPS